MLLLVAALLGGGALLARPALQVGVGYSAKQLCSAVFVAGLPDRFVIQRDIEPRMAVLGPLSGALDLRTEATRGVAEASLLGVSARAVHKEERGCVLHETGTGVAPLAATVPAAAEVGVPAALSGAFDAAFAEPAGGGRNTLALLVSRGGEIVAERYAAPVDAGTRLQGWSMNKSLMATWIGMQAQRGALDPSAAVAQLLSDTALGSGVDARLTLLHLLQMESGLDFEERYGPGSDVTNMLYRAHDMWREPAAAGQARAPGERFYYSSGDTVLASYLWQQSLAEPYPAWIAREFAAPLGVASLVAEADAGGTQVGSSYAYMTARDWLRVGQLWLDAWHGRSDLLEQGWLRASVAPRASDAAGRYGRGFWLNTGRGTFAAVPESMFYASGNSGQFVIVVPQWELVVFRAGLTEPSVSSGVDGFLDEMVRQLQLEG